MSDDDLQTPEVRLKLLADKSVFDVNPSVKAIRYVRTAKELIRTADAYYDDNLLEHSYLLYMRYLTLCIEKLKDQPGFKEIPDEDKKEMRTNCKRILPMAEKVKAELLGQYKTEYDEFIRNKTKLEEERREAERKLQLDRIKASSYQSQNFPQPFTDSAATSYSGVPASAVTSAASVSTIKAVNYDYMISDNSVSNGCKVSPTQPQPQPIQQQPQFDRRSKPCRYLSSPMGTDSLRTVIIPGDLISKFTYLSSANSAKNIETCGVLCGKVIRDQLVITHLVIPKQTGTPDSCTTLNEEEIYNIMDRYSLIQLGWIHTHPSQTSFLSSVDLHTHLSYQLMMGESIAIVVAASKQEWNVFTLTPTGMEALQKCADSGFHPHHQLDEPYFVDASHTSVEPNRYIIVEDLRN